MAARSLRRRFTFVITLLAVVVGTVGVGSPAAAAVPEPDDDPFYQPTPGFEGTAPGTVLRSRSVSVTGLGIPLPVRSTQALVRSTDATGDPVAVATTLIVPTTPWLVGRRPLVSYQQAIDSLGDQCNPSYTLRTGTMQELPILSLALLQGWAVVVPDFQGPQDAYGAGRMHGHAVLDSIRGVESLPGTGLAGVGTPVGLWGYSGGGLATAWAGELQPSYAPELDVEGVAAGGTASDLEPVLRNIDGGPFSGVVLAAVFGASREYPELAGMFNDEGRATADQIGDMCQAQLALTLPFRHLNEFTTSADPVAEPVAQSLLAEQLNLGTSAPTAPTFLYHSVLDELIPVTVAHKLKADYCRQGSTIQYHEDYTSEHITLAGTGAPLAVSYLAARFNGVPAPSNC